MTKEWSALCGAFDGYFLNAAIPPEAGLWRGSPFDICQDSEIKIAAETLDSRRQDIKDIKRESRCRPHCASHSKTEISTNEVLRAGARQNLRISRNRLMKREIRRFCRAPALNTSF